MNHLPKLGRLLSSTEEQAMHVAPILREVAKLDSTDVCLRMESSLEGLTFGAATRRLDQFGPNVVTAGKTAGWLSRLWTAVRNPLVILLSALATISFVTGDPRAGAVMAVMVVLGVVLRFVQESRASAAAASLAAMVHLTATAIRRGREVEVAVSTLVPGDLVKVSAGDMIPADVRIIAAKDLFVSQATLTGESTPVEKTEHWDCRSDVSPLELGNLCFLGTSVESGSATAVVLTTGRLTYFGSMAKNLGTDAGPTSFDRGIQQFTTLMIRFMLVMVPLVFLISGFTRHHWHEAFLFALAIAVGLTPEMLPMIVTVCLSKGALAMSKKRVIVKQLGAIQNFGAMDILCTDKTGTLTMDQVVLQHHCDVLQNESRDVFRDAYLISSFQTGLKSALDRAVLNHLDATAAMLEGFRKLDEIPFDFTRRMMSVVVETPDHQHRLLTKGAPESVFSRCTFYELNGNVLPLEPHHTADLAKHYENLGADGYRVLAVAYKPLVDGPVISKADECDLILKGYIAFMDPPKESASEAIRRLEAHGVTVKVLTGDNDIITRRVCQEVGLDPGEILLGKTVETMNEADLAAAAARTRVFARLAPAHKERIIRALQHTGHVVGFMGDGINDAPALHAADVGISVDSAVDIAKAAASLILLDKDLNVLDEGVTEGRKVFVNILKYVRMGASSSFGNMFSVLGASTFLPFSPMTPLQILTNNLLYDFSQVPIPTDAVEPDQISGPRPWDLGEIRKFVLCIGPLSSIFDYTTFFIMLYGFGCWDPARASIFQTAWFVESLVTQTLIVHVIRTNKIPFVQGWASWQLTLTTILVIALAGWLPYSPLAATLGFTALPAVYWPILLCTVFGYVALTQTVKRWLIRRAWTRRQSAPKVPVLRDKTFA